MNLYKITQLVYMYASVSIHKETLTWVVFLPTHIPNYIVYVTYLLTYSMEQSPSWEANQ